jgi:hypothetical protein
MGRLTVRCASVSGWGAPLAGLFRPTGPVRERVRLGRAIGRTVSPCRSGARACPVGARHWPDCFALPVRYASVSGWGAPLAGLFRRISPVREWVGLRAAPYPKHRVIASSSGRIVSGVSSPMLETRNVLPLILPYPPSIWKPDSCRSR